MKQCLIFFDGFLSCCQRHSHGPLEDIQNEQEWQLNMVDMNRYEKYGMIAWRQLAYSISLKVHVIELHIMHQFTEYNGIGSFDKKIH